MDETTESSDALSGSDGVRPPVKQRVRWLVAAVVLVAALLVIFLEELRQNDIHQPVWREHAVGEFEPAPGSTWIEGGLKSTITGGVWRSQVATGERIFMLVEPGNDPDEDEWYFRLDAARVFCTPKSSDSEWVFSDCHVQGSITGFEARIERSGKFRLEADLDHGGQHTEVVMTKSVNMVEPGPEELYRFFRP